MALTMMAMILMVSFVPFFDAAEAQVDGNDEEFNEEEHFACENLRGNYANRNRGSFNNNKLTKFTTVECKPVKT